MTVKIQVYNCLIIEEKGEEKYVKQSRFILFQPHRGNEENR